MSWNTRVRLFNNVPFDFKNNHTRWFDSKAQQENYFNNLGAVDVETNGSHVVISGGEVNVLSYSDSIDNINYIIINNNITGESNANKRTYYCFVTSVEYVSTKVTKIKFEVDVLQTYMFDLNFKQSFVERQHENTPNRIKENLNIGSEYLNISSTLVEKEIDKYFSTMLVSTTSALNSETNQVYGGVVNGVMTPLKHYLILVPKQYGEDKPLSVTFNNETLQAGTNFGGNFDIRLFELFNDEEKANRIVSISYLPVFPYNTTLTRTKVNGGEWGVGWEYTIHAINTLLPTPIIDNHRVLFVNNRSAYVFNNYININVKSTIDNYMSSNGITDPKLKQYPFVRVVLRDNLGNQFVMQPEYIEGTNINIDLLTSISSTPTVAYRITDYADGKGMTNALVTQLNADVEIVNEYTATYIQGRKNSDKVGVTNGVIGGLLQTAGGIGVAVATGGTGVGAVTGMGAAIGGVVNTFNAISSMAAKYEDMQNIPPTLSTQAGASNINVGYGYSAPQIDIEVADVEHLKRANSFLKQFGHAVKDVVDINLKTRTHYNFIKTIGCNVVGKVPQNHLDKVVNIFDSGVTLWHVDDIYNYKVANGVR